MAGRIVLEFLPFDTYPTGENFGISAADAFDVDKLWTFLDWINQHKEWLFSGVGIVVVAYFGKSLIFIIKNIRHLSGFRFNADGFVSGQKPDTQLEKELSTYTPKKVIAERARLIRNHENRLAHDPSYRSISHRALRKMPARFNPQNQEYDAMEDIMLLKNLERFEEVQRRYRGFAVYAKLVYFLLLSVVSLALLKMLS